MDASSRRQDLPGAEIVEPGLRDIEAGTMTVEALMVLDSAVALREVGVPVPDGIAQGEAGLIAHERLVAEMGLEDGDARFRDLQRRVISYRDMAEALETA